MPLSEFRNEGRPERGPLRRLRIIVFVVYVLALTLIIGVVIWIDLGPRND
jgi:hypothetical protein